MVDFSALLRAEVQKQNQNRAEWTGEFNGQIVTFYAKPRTAADNHQVLAKYPQWNTNFDVEGMAMYIALKAEDEEGNKVFSVAKDFPVLKNLRDTKVVEIFNGLSPDEEQSEEEAEADHEAQVKN